MAVSFGYWADCADPKDLEAMWKVPEVCTEWLGAGEVKGQKVHISRDPDGQPYLTQTEMRAVAEIVVSKHFHSRVDPVMVCAIAELESDRQLLVMRSDCKSKETKVGLMQLAPKTAEWLMRGRSEEFIVRAYKGGTKEATHKSTLHYWKVYLSVKESLPSRKSVDDRHLSSNNLPPVPALGHAHAPLGYLPPISEDTGASGHTKWDSRASPEDMEEMWNHPDVFREWSKSRQKRGKVRFSEDENKRPYLSQVEVKAVADIILFRYFSTKAIKPEVLCALAEVISSRFVNGNGARPGIMGIDYSTAYWLYVELGYRAYRLDSADDLNKPFVSMYFGAAYVAWLSEYEGRARSQEFVVRAYLEGPKNVDSEENGPLRLKYEEALSKYRDTTRNHDSCSIM